MEKSKDTLFVMAVLLFIQWPAHCFSQYNIQPYSSYIFNDIFNDNFFDNSNNWPVSDDENGMLKIESNSFFIKRKKSLGATISLKTITINQSSSFIIQTEVKKISGINNNGFGIAWGAANDNVSDYFQFIISGDGSYEVGKWKNGNNERIIKWTESPYINKWDGSRNKLSIIKEGTSMKFFINDQYVNEIKFRKFIGDRFGFLVCKNQAVEFDYIKLSYIEKQKYNDIPEIIVTEPHIDRGIQIVATKRIKVAGRAIDSDGIYEIKINGTDAVLQKEGAFSAYVPLAVGENRISIKATDTKMKSAYREFSINRKAEERPYLSQTSEKRLALIIGNSEYTFGGSLANSVNDARAMQKSLESLGFKVFKFENSDQLTMKKAIDEFGRNLKNHTVGLFFYAGHGVQVNGSNYLIPINANLENENDVEYDAVRADRVLAKMESAGSKTNIIILDACRDNPFERSWRRGTKGNGLAFMNAPSGSIIAYATSPGSTASDGTGSNGLYTSAILQHIQTPNITIEQMFKRVRSTIIDWSGDKQVPWESTSLRGNFYFNQE